MISKYIDSLVAYGLRKGLIEEVDEIYVRNRLLEVIGEEYYEPSNEPIINDLEKILNGLFNFACQSNLCEDNIISRDLLDAKLMAMMTPFPHEVIKKFFYLYKKDPIAATDYFYKLSKDTNYIRQYRIDKNIKWIYSSEYGELEITINLSKPEKDPIAIAMAGRETRGGYPSCQLCIENVGYSGRLNHPARQNHRVIPITINRSSWYLQYSPYVYYNEHCIVFSEKHIPMRIDQSTFQKLLDFVKQFSHYILGSNADLPIVGGSILSHDHFQGGHYEFPMIKAKMEENFKFSEYEDVEAGIVRWPMSVLRIRSEKINRLVSLAYKILSVWRGYSDMEAFIIAESNGEPHNTITPVASKRNGKYQLDLVLRNNITTEEHPLGLYHPHASLHHIKKENIGLIEVMGLAILPPRLKRELEQLESALIEDRDIKKEDDLIKHTDWIGELKEEYKFTRKNTKEILENEVGKIYATILEHAGVYKRTVEGRRAFKRFIDTVNAREDI